MSLRLVFKSVWNNPGNQGQRLHKSFAAVAWQLRKRTFRTPQILRLASGARFKAHPDCVVSSALIYSDWPEFRELQFVRNQLQRGDMLIDVGANVGHVSLLLSDVVGAENIIAFEPTPLTFRRLTENWQLNGWNTEHLLQRAVGRVAGSVRMPDTDRPDTKNSVASTSGTASTVEVPLVSLDSCRPRWQGKSVGVLKIDVEGYEGEVFAGARDLLREDRPRLIMFESLGGVVEPAIAAVLREARYTVFQLDAAGRPQIGSATAQNLFAVPEEHVSALR